jgi:hypothetical protein
MKTKIKNNTAGAIQAKKNRSLSRNIVRQPLDRTQQYAPNNKKIVPSPLP